MSNFGLPARMSVKDLVLGLVGLFVLTIVTAIVFPFMLIREAYEKTK